jgi:hypothetical protein
MGFAKMGADGILFPTLRQARSLAAIANDASDLNRLLNDRPQGNKLKITIQEEVSLYCKPA